MYNIRLDTTIDLTYRSLWSVKNAIGTHADEFAQWRYTETNTNTNPNPDPNRYRRCCPDPNAS